MIVLVAPRAAPRLDGVERKAVWCAALWAVSGFALTMFLPVRSDLYALTPSVGSALVCGVLVQSCYRAEPRRVKTTLAALVFLPLLLLPVYRSRNASGVAPADISSRLLRHPEAMQNATPADIERAFGRMRELAVALGALTK